MTDGDRPHSHWRKVRPISLPSEDNARLERLTERAETFLPRASYSLVVRAALRQLSILPEGKFRAAIEAVPAVRYGREPKSPRPRLSPQELQALREKVGL